MGKRALSFAMSIAIFSTQCAFAYQPEVSVWEMRRASQSPANSSLTFPIVSRPASRLAASALIADRVAAAIPAGLVRARVASTGKAGAPAIIFIQDIHRNAEAQANIGRAVAALSQSGLASAIALDGAEGTIDLGPLSKHAAVDALARAADFLLSRNEISGPAEIPRLHRKRVERTARSAFARGAEAVHVTAARRSGTP